MPVKKTSTKTASANPATKKPKTATKSASKAPRGKKITRKESLQTPANAELVSNPQAIEVLKPLEGKRTSRNKNMSSVQDALQAKKMLLESATPKQLEKLGQVPDYLNTARTASSPYNYLPQRLLPDPETLENLLDTYFQVEIAPSIISLCVFLGISRDNLMDCIEGISCKDVSILMQKAVDRIEAKICRGMMLGYFHPIGSIFYLKNAFGYTDRQEREDKSVASVEVNIKTQED